MTRDRLLTHRQQFPALQNKAYFNYGGQGPLSTAALTAIQTAFADSQQLGPFSLATGQRVEQISDRLRTDLAALLQTQSENITLTENVSVGCNIALWGVDWQAGDRLLITDCEHPSVIATAQAIAQRFGVELDIWPLQAAVVAGQDLTEAFAAQLNSRTRLAAISHVLWNYGTVLPLAAIAEQAHRQDCLLLVDGAQSVGLLPLDLPATGVDFYAFTGHKWLCGPEGVGGLYSRPESRATSLPTWLGWRGVEKNTQGRPIRSKSDGRRYEIATSAYPLYAGLSAAIAQQADYGTIEDRYNRSRQLAQWLWQSLQALPKVRCLATTLPQAGLISFQIDSSQSPFKIVSHLEGQGLQIRSLVGPDCLRACCHYLTLETELESLVAAIAQI
ncbi:aminotransferase class V-fold PLP-dependent enzyme [Synechococcus elongatus]|uniref:L-cysteine/cystine lyase n=2 Tax=Synechococcus elongatus TaxID=32046 RepID=Q31NT4_SYNE7|nr:aminotransferase class V-fold PLP-dependent enzyme [Synechococcus elongatus]ABB57285.1 L-cysteine/cystine lyase [Synechococcus elongatus PCC 7942 = FACHB-805]AJD58202.1 cysteine lyase [Synechococcus elongatus UTEX 2973]MBD2587692.1 aminotransferase class V-fold PLP-dependent enzyme [Synechococcus elongatus FACHB-242]MBD2688529.1 aminotransferase class V-fold PLP-dependent enzyme [Synechococcus elongatus FACHB-1061]MBD2707600.1 aminotransferase class V-fold PLP-dependent enzyme [Synechococcu